jgi:hypothetical protein
MFIIFTQQSIIYIKYINNEFNESIMNSEKNSYDDYDYGTIISSAYFSKYLSFINPLRWLTVIRHSAHLINKYMKFPEITHHNIICNPSITINSLIMHYRNKN